MADGIEVQIEALLDNYSTEAKAAINKVIQEVAKESVQKLKETSPKKSGDYSRGWAVKKIRDGGATVYNRTHPQLTHLLERGHTVANQYGNYGNPGGRVAAQPHIKRVEEWANQEVVRRIEEELGH